MAVCSYVDLCVCSCVFVTGFGFEFGLFRSFNVPPNLWYYIVSLYLLSYTREFIFACCTRIWILLCIAFYIRSDAKFVSIFFRSAICMTPTYYLHIFHRTRQQLCFLLYWQNIQTSSISRYSVHHCVSSLTCSINHTSEFLYFQASHWIWNLKDPS